LPIDLRDDSETYPAAPWTLRGWGLATVGLVDTRAAAAFVPAGAKLVSVVPGKTIGGLFFLSYDSGSLKYRELNIVAGLIRVGRRFAFLLPRLYVDSAASLAGGRDIWAVPKELATFAIDRTASATAIDVHQNGSPVCRLTWPARSRGLRLPLPVPLPSIGIRDDAFLFFTGQLLATMAPVRAAVEMPLESEFAALKLDRPLFALSGDHLVLTVPAARIVPRGLVQPLPKRTAIAVPVGSRRSREAYCGARRGPRITDVF
jgi:hypothetical protein